MRKASVVQKIRNIRIEKGLTQTELAERCNVSKSLISKVESNKASIHLDLLMDIAKALDVRVSEILEETPNNSQAMIVRESDRRHWVTGMNGKIGFDYFGLASSKKPNLDAFYVVISDEACKASRFASHEGIEFIYVIDGRLKIEFRDEEYVLKAGDTANFDSSLDHRLMPANLGEKVELLMIFAK